MSPTGRALRAAISASFWGKRTVSPARRMSSSLPATMCSVMTAPIAVVISPSVGEKRARLIQKNGIECLSRTLLVHLVAVQAPETVESCCLVALGKSWIVEDGGDEVVNGAAHDHDGLPDMNEFAGAFANDVHAKHLT